LIRIATAAENDDRAQQEIRIAWTGKAKDTAIVVDGKNSSERERNEGLIQLIVRSHVWAQR
jgi:hypothetical protein